MRALNNILVTGGAGFIGSNLIRFLLSSSTFTGKIINVDKLTYAGNRHSLHDIETESPDRYSFVCADICDRVAMEHVFQLHDIDTVVHLAAESHVDRSIEQPDVFIQTNIVGTFVLLDVARVAWGVRDDVLFHHVSTDEVFGTLGDEGYFCESSPYAPRSPYSASKAGSDHLVMAYSHTYGMPITLSQCSNNYGPYQFPEKFIPLMIENMLDGKPLPVYGDGMQIRDWLFVDDHASALWMIMQDGQSGESYTVGGENEWKNCDLLHYLCKIVSEEAGISRSSLEVLITFVDDRLGHDRRYAIDCSKIKTTLAWERAFSFEEGLRATVRWYLDNRQWVQKIKNGEYLRWIEEHYGDR